MTRCMTIGSWQNVDLPALDHIQRGANARVESALILWLFLHGLKGRERGDGHVWEAK